MLNVTFEAGQVWQFNGTSQAQYLLTRVDSDGLPWVVVNNHGCEVLFRAIAEKSWLISPAPKPGQRWSKGPSDAENDLTITVDAVKGGLTAHTEAGHWPKIAPVVEMARWLLANGYRHVEPTAARQLQDGDIIRCDVYTDTGLVVRPGRYGDVDITWRKDTGRFSAPLGYEDAEANAELAAGTWRLIRPELDATAAEPVTPARANEMLDAALGAKPAAPPAAESLAPPWTRADSRRAVDEAVAALRGEPFVEAIRAVLVAESEKNAPRPDEIDDIIQVCREWELRRGEIAPGRRELTASQREECADHVNCAVVTLQCPEWLGDIYERARAAQPYRQTVRRRTK